MVTCGCDKQYITVEPMKMYRTSFWGVDGWDLLHLLNIMVIILNQIRTKLLTKMQFS